MKGWTLETVRSLSVEDYDEIIAWLQDEADRLSGDQSVDMNALLEARHGTAEDE